MLCTKNTTKKREQNVAKGKSKTPMKKSAAKKSATKPALKAAAKSASKKSAKPAAKAMKPAAKKSAKPAAKSASKKTAAMKTPAKKTVAVKKSAAAKKPAPKLAAKLAAKPVKKTAPTAASIKANPKMAAKPAKKTASAKQGKLDLSEFVTPLDDRILVQPKELETMTAGGLYIPDTVSERGANAEGYVVSVGRGHRSPKGYVRPMDVKIGDKVLFAEHSGSEIKVQEHNLLILREADVLGIIESI